MGLLDKLTTQGGSVYSYGNGQTPATNPGATQQSKLHADGSTPGYSLNGSDFSEVNAAYLAYNDGFNNSLPKPSLLDLNGAIPIGPLSDPSVGSINNTFSQGQYLNNLPG
jgi:hypothetical protein